MSDTTTTYPEQLMLPGQAAAPGGPVDMTVMYLMHHAFRRDLVRFAATVPATPVDDHPTWIALAERWARFAEILHHHHSGEDAGIWPYLLERADDSERETLLAMEAEHERIDPVLSSCAELFAALADEPADGRSREEARAGLTVRLAEARELLHGHLRHEESGAMVILQRHMTEADWKRIEKEHFKKEDGKLSELAYMVAWIAEAIEPATLDAIFRQTGQAFRVIWWFGRRGFRRLEQRAFRHLPAQVR